MDARAIVLSETVVASQRQASDPAASVWVRANAGSGKTHVLTERVMRLLLGGVRPEEILCLTYTKAAAAEMRRRVSARLAEWALLAEPELVERLGKLEGRPPSRETLTRARCCTAFRSKPGCRSIFPSSRMSRPMRWCGMPGRR